MDLLWVPITYLCKTRVRVYWPVRQDNVFYTIATTAVVVPHLICASSITSLREFNKIHTISSHNERQAEKLPLLSHMLYFGDTLATTYRPRDNMYEWSHGCGEQRGERRKSRGDGATFSHGQ